MPGVGLLELAAAAGLDYHQANGHSTLSTYSSSFSSATLIVLDGFTILRPTVVADTRLRTSGLRSSCLWCTIADDGAVDIYNEGDDDSRALCAEGSISICTESHADGKQSSSCHEQEPDWTLLAREVDAARDLCVLSTESDALYEMLSTAGLQYGPSFRLIQGVSIAEDNKTSVCRLSLGNSSFQSSHLLPPPLMDALLQSAAAVSAMASAVSSGVPVSQVPFAFDRVWIRQEAVQSLWKSDWCLGHVKMLSMSDKMSVFDCTIVSADGIVVVHMEGVHVRTMTADLSSVTAQEGTRYRRRGDDMELRSTDSEDGDGSDNDNDIDSAVDVSSVPRDSVVSSGPHELIGEWQYKPVQQCLSGETSIVDSFQRVIVVGDNRTVCDAIADKLRLPVSQKTSAIGSDVSLAPADSSAVHLDRRVDICSFSELHDLSNGIKAAGDLKYDMAIVVGPDVLSASDCLDAEAMIASEGLAMTRWLDTICHVCVAASRMLMVTVGGHRVHKDNDDQASDSTMSMFTCALSGAVKSAHTEYPRVEMAIADICIDSSATTGLTSEVVGSIILEELAVWDGEIEVSYRDGCRHVRRFIPIQVDQDMNKGPMKLHLTQRGLLENLVVCPQSARNDPLFGEVEVEVCSASLNFRDVLNILGMYPGDPGNPGGEYAGIISRVGAGVTDVFVGDEVIGFGSGCLQKYITASRMLIHPKPSSVDMVIASTIPIVTCTVEYCLNDLASLKAGETILIHAAAGGVGLVALQYAHQIGARVIATASKGKKQYLHDLGVEYVFSSRDADEFATELEISLGKNFTVDVVLNSLSDKYISASIDLLSSKGRFVDIGKRNIWTHDEVQSRRPDVQYHIVALDSMCYEKPLLVQDLLHRVCSHFDNNLLKPLPTKTYDMMSEYLEALNHLRYGNNIGKVVLTYPQSLSPILPTSIASAEIQAIGTGAYVITGGLGGLGLVTAKTLVDIGASNIVLVSRSGRVAYEGQGLEKDLAWLQTESGANVQIVPCDVSDEASVVRMLDEARQLAGGRIEGIIHAAGILRDGLMVNGSASAGCNDVWMS